MQSTILTDILLKKNHHKGKNTILGYVSGFFCSFLYSKYFITLLLRSCKIYGTKTNSERKTKLEGFCIFLWAD